MEPCWCNEVPCPLLLFPLLRTAAGANSEMLRYGVYRKQTHPLTPLLPLPPHPLQGSRLLSAKENEEQEEEVDDAESDNANVVDKRQSWSEEIRGAELR